MVKNNRKILYIIGAIFLFFLFGGVTKAFVDVKEGTVETKEGYAIPELFKESLGNYFDWSIERTSTYYGWTPAKVGGSATVDESGNVVSVSSENYPFYYLTANGLEGIWAVGGVGDFDHILSYKELNDICANDKDFHDVPGHKDWPDEGAHVMICSMYEKFRTVDCNFECNHKDNYFYSFDYQAQKDGSWASLDKNQVYKCEDIKVIFNPAAEWFADLSHECCYNDEKRITLERRIDLLSPPTGFSQCADQDSCLEQSQEYSLKEGIYGKGVQQVPENFVTTAQNSLNAGSDTTIKCSGGICTPYASGSRVVKAVAPESKYFGECRAEEAAVNVSDKNVDLPLVKITPPPATIGAIESAANLNIVNRPPVATVSFPKETIAPNEEIQATCNIVDPDSCVDKIVKVKWDCYDFQGKQVDCSFMGKEGSWNTGTYTEVIPESSATNPYSATIKFTSSKVGGYAVTCEASDNDIYSSSTGVGVAGIGVCNGNCNGGEIAAHAKYCAILADGSTSKTVCADKAKITYDTYQSGIVPDQYEWKCSKDDSAKSGADTMECDYGSAGTYSPELRIHDKLSNEWVECASQTTTKINNESKCTVGIRNVSSGGDYETDLQAKVGETLEAKISGECLEKGDITWNIKDGTKISEDKTNGTVKFKFEKAGEGYIEASTNGVACSKAHVLVKDTIQWGQ